MTKTGIRHFFILLLVFFHSLTKSFSQNLVPNPDFEEYLQCPISFNNGTAGHLYMWTSPDTGTPDYYHRCSKTDAGVPYNWAGVSDPLSGDGYVGIYVYMPGGYREYLQANLAEPLKVGSQYKIRFHYKQSSNSEYLTGDISMFITKATGETTVDTLLHHSDSISFDIADQWRVFDHTYRARGGEDMIVIGNFTPTSEMEKIKVPLRYIEEPMLDNSSYFYVDNVSVTLFDEFDHEPVEDSIEFPDIDFGEPMVLDNVLFDFNSSTMDPSSYSQLDSLVLMLKGNLFQIELRGFTDSVGSEKYNYALAEARATGVGKYLIDRGIIRDRIKAVGYGELLPASSNTSDKGRKLNRRVEIVFFR